MGDTGVRPRFSSDSRNPYMDALGAVRIPDPTTAGDFLRRLDRGSIDDLSEAINTARLRVWKKNKRSFFERAVIDVDGTIAGTHGECKEGMDMRYKGIWGYAPLLVTLANTGEVRLSCTFRNLDDRFRACTGCIRR